VNVAFPGGVSEAQCRLGEGYGTKRGSVADFNSDLKHTKYKHLYDFDPKFLHPITFETNGCPGIATMAFLSTVKKYIGKRGSVHQKNAIRQWTRRIVTKTSASLARALGHAILDYRVECQKGAGREQ